MDSSRFLRVMRAIPAVVGVAVVGCAAPVAPPPRPLAVEAGGPVAALGDANRDSERDRQRRGVGLPPLPRSPPVLRAPPPAPAPWTSGPAAALPVPGNALSRMSAVPASPLANPPGGFGAGRPW